MKLFLLRPKELILTAAENPWNPWYDKLFGCVVRAENEEEARALVKSKGDEAYDKNPWLDSTLSDCTELTTDGEKGEIIADFRSA